MILADITTDKIHF